MNAHEQHTEVLVGYDGTPCGGGALRFAAAEAALRHAPLHVLHIRRYAPALPDPILAQAAELLSASGAQSRTSFEIALGDPADLLVARSAEAALLVLGRGSAGALAPSLGSVACEAVTRAQCPVAVVTDDGHTYRSGRGDVVVGVDPGGWNDAALDLAFEEAYARRTGLVAVQACSHPLGAGEGIDTWAKGIATGPVADAGRLLHEAVRAVHARFPAVPVTEVIQHGRAGRVLVDAAQGACLLVVGARGHGPVIGKLLGSVGQYVIRHAVCPVLVAAQRPVVVPALLALGGP